MYKFTAAIIATIVPTSFYILKKMFDLDNEISVFKSIMSNQDDLLQKSLKEIAQNQEILVKQNLLEIENQKTNKVYYALTGVLIVVGLILIGFYFYPSDFASTPLNGDLNLSKVDLNQIVKLRKNIHELSNQIEHLQLDLSNSIDKMARIQDTVRTDGNKIFKYLLKK